MEKLLEKFFRTHPTESFTISQLITKLSFTKEYTTVFRAVKILFTKKIVLRKRVGRSTFYNYNTKNIEEYFNRPFFERPEVQYTPSFLREYIPKSSSFFEKKELDMLLEWNKGTELSTDYLLKNKRLLENLIIDFSYSSSFLEGNSYTYLDTEVLIRYKETAKGKTEEEATMILNHKDAIEYVTMHKNELSFSKKELFSIHTLLGKGLLEKKALGVIRPLPVKIGGSSYTPSDNMHILEEILEEFLRKLTLIQNPFEQSLFILVFLPYFQLFEDINKRTARVFCNIPLLKHNLIPFSFLTVEKKKYITALLAIYELNDVTLLKEVFLDAYKKSHERYFM